MNVSVRTAFSVLILLLISPWTGSAQQGEPPQNAEETRILDAAREERFRDLITPVDPEFTPSRSLALSELLETIEEPAGRISAIQCYWKIFEYSATKAIASRHQRRMQNLTAAVPEQWLLPLIQSAKQTRKTAELQLANAQQLMAYQLQESASLVGVVPETMPLLGVYKTRFEEIQQIRPMSLQAHFLNESLPLWYQSVAGREDAVIAAKDDLNAVLETITNGPESQKILQDALNHLYREELRFLNSVIRYNQEIAAYAIPLASPQTPVEKVSAMLVKRESPNAPFAEFTLDRESLTQQGGGLTPTNPRPLLRAEWELHQSVTARKFPFETQVAPTPAVIHSRQVAVPDSIPPSTPGPTQAPERFESEEWTSPISTSEMPVESTFPSQEQPIQRVNYETNTLQQTPADNSFQNGMYSGLQSMPEEDQVREFAHLLHWERKSDRHQGESLSLNEWLGQLSPSQRPDGIRLYWKTREALAIQQVKEEALERCLFLQVPTLELRHSPGGARAMLLLRAKELSLQAELDQSQAEIVQLQYRLAKLLNNQNQDASFAESPRWLLPSSTPHAAGYQFNLALENDTAEQLKQLTTMPAHLESLFHFMEQTVIQVLEQDRLSAELQTQYMQGQVTLAALFQHYQFQDELTQQFLEMLTTYNQTICEVAALLLPQNASADQWTRSLILPEVTN
ncbi:Hypothetical protein PBC10988_1560 [Planctomycetales bacterium 10988]|nr:Hypothetical protein PBC10988_1560 [Planctomycetales bacterium 10988]